MPNSSLETRLNVWLVFPRFKMPTGAERFILGLARGLVEHGHTPHVLTQHFDERCRALVGAGVRIHSSGQRFDWTGNHYLDSALRYAASWGLGAKVPSDADAVVFFAAASVPALARHGSRRVPARRFYFCFEPPRFAYRDRAAILARVGGARWVVGPASRLWRWLDRRAVRHAERILVFGPFIESQARELYPSMPVARVTPCVDVPTDGGGDAIARIREQLSIGARPVVLTVNFLHPRKRVELFLASIAEAAKREPAVVGVVVGEGPERARLEERARTLGVADRIRFAGYVADEELGSWYRLASIYLHTAHDESFGLTVLEAGSSGVPVVAVREGGVLETLEEGVTGLLVAPEAASIGAALVKLLEDRGLAASLAEAAAGRMPANFSRQRMISEFLRALAPDPSARAESPPTPRVEGGRGVW